jgi:hypothetical protein
MTALFVVDKQHCCGAKQLDAIAFVAELKGGAAEQRGQKLQLESTGLQSSHQIRCPDTQ